MKLRAFVFCALAIWLGKTSFENFYKDGKGLAWAYAITMDGRGYYAYLPGMFIHSDPTYAFHLRHNAQQDPNINFTHEYGDGKRLNKYFIGEAVLLSPFFLAAHGVAHVFGFETHGYSKPYYFAVAFAGCFYVSFGLFLLSLFLRSLFRLNWVSLAVPIFILFGSNLLYYGVYEPSMSHAYSFFLVSAFLFWGDKTSRQSSFLRLVILGVIIGMIGITRPVNLIVLSMLPFLMVRSSSLPLTTPAAILKNGLSVAFPAFMVFFVQLAAYYWQTGDWFVDSYRDEGFNWTDPQIFNSLFSYRKGLFIYSPIALLSLLSIGYLYKGSSVRMINLTATLAIAVYVLSSWHNWEYGWAFGLRAYVEFLPLFAIGLAALLTYAPEKAKYAVLLIAVGCCFYAQHLTALVTVKALPLSGIDRQLFWDALFQL